MDEDYLCTHYIYLSSMQVQHFSEVREEVDFMEVYRQEPRLADKMFALLATPIGCKRRRSQSPSYTSSGPH